MNYIYDILDTLKQLQREYQQLTQTMRQQNNNTQGQQNP